MKVQLLALQDEGSDAILDYGQNLSREQIEICGLSYPADGYLLQCPDRHRRRRRPENMTYYRELQ